MDSMAAKEQFRRRSHSDRVPSDSHHGRIDDDHRHHPPPTKKAKQEPSVPGCFVPSAFLAPLPQRMVLPQSSEAPQRGRVSSGGSNSNRKKEAVVSGGGGGGRKEEGSIAKVDDGISPVARGCRQFWRAGDYDDANGIVPAAHSSGVGLDHVRVHPKFLHSNATSHKWALGAFAELLDNAVDEIVHGATYVNVDLLKNPKDGSKMLLVEDNGGGMTPNNIRQCMSLGYSVKSKSSNTIGQYGNGFKTSTMRLGSDVIVFTRCPAADGQSETRSIGLLSYTFLRSTKKEDTVVPMIDFVQTGQGWKPLTRSTPADWNMNLRTVLLWSPFVSEEDLIGQFDYLGNKGTRIIIYNLWEDDEGKLELDFEADQEDIQIRGANRDEKNIEMAKQYPNSKHFLTYRHSLRSYAAILYLKLPTEFRITLRGSEVEHHDIVKDMIEPKKITYKPQQLADGVVNNNEVSAVLNIGFVKDARHHIDVQGFNVYHKNRLIKPFWRVWNAAGSDGRGVIGVLEANFIEPAHDKQGFERTTLLLRLEARLKDYQKQFWTSKCHEIGYAQRVKPKTTTPSSSSKKASNSIISKSSPSPSIQDGKILPLTGPNHKRKLSSLKHSERASPEEEEGTVKHSSIALRDEVSCESKGEGKFSLLQSLAEERVKSKQLEMELGEQTKLLEVVKKEAQTSMNKIQAITEKIQHEKEWRDAVEQILRESLKSAEQTIARLKERVRQLEEGQVVDGSGSS
ncbi:unnamed protein product [Linum tenue]|uniref:Morc S5 domain-containing protein n=1 Tax=Linum tenue TaxID=586396 RepID=A0AAV0S3M4_9ROSI|nr:unnamed protein product [Linum tenue]